MKFKCKPLKSNLFFMTSIFILSLITCLFWLSFKEYIFFLIYFVLTILVGYFYCFTSYIIVEKFLIVKIGFIRIKFKWHTISKIIITRDGIIINIGKFKFTIYPANKEIFVAKLKTKIDKQKFA